MIVLEITKEQYKIGLSNGISRSLLIKRVRKCGWDIEKAMTHPIIPIGKRGKRSEIFTPKQFKKAKKNGLCRSTIYNRVLREGLTPEEAVTKPIKKVFTLEQLKKAEELGLAKRTLYTRVHKGMTPEEACSTPKGGRKGRHDWDVEIYAMYKGEELLADGTVYEIAEKLFLDVNSVKFYGTESARKRNKSGNRLELVYLGNDDDEE